MLEQFLYLRAVALAEHGDRGRCPGADVAEWRQEAVATGTQCLSALGMVAVMLMVLPMQSVLEVIPLTLDEMAREFTEQLDEAVKELSKA